MAELSHRALSERGFGRGYPSFPHKEMAVCRKVYRESIEKDLDIGDFRPRSLLRLQRFAAAFAAPWGGLNPTTTSIIYREEPSTRRTDERKFQRESRYFRDCVALQGFHSVLFSTRR
jgi:hypothetical protein